MREARPGPKRAVTGQGVRTHAVPLASEKGATRRKEVTQPQGPEHIRYLTKLDSSVGRATYLLCDLTQVF